MYININVVELSGLKWKKTIQTVSNANFKASMMISGFIRGHGIMGNCQTREDAINAERFTRDFEQDVPAYFSELARRWRLNWLTYGPINSILSFLTFRSHISSNFVCVTFTCFL